MAAIVGELGAGGSEDSEIVRVVEGGRRERWETRDILDFPSCKREHRITSFVDHVLKALHAQLSHDGRFGIKNVYLNSPRVSSKPIVIFLSSPLCYPAARPVYRILLPYRWIGQASSSVEE